MHHTSWRTHPYGNSVVRHEAAPELLVIGGVVLQLEHATRDQLPNFPLQMTTGSDSSFKLFTRVYCMASECYIRLAYQGDSAERRYLMLYTINSVVERVGSGPVPEAGLLGLVQGM
jgi:hypothetical protein